MSTTGPGKDDPLPVKARSEAEAWARQLTEHLAGSAGIRIDPATVRPFFSPCTGRNGEHAPDDRYFLMYSAHSAVPLARHPEVVRQVRAVLQREGLTITGYRELLDGRPDTILDAEHPSDYTVTVESTAGGADHLLLRVTTPCLLPPPAP
ncbi:hypothetical protein [Kitasatospora sp. NPDC088346]|uniref:hypothetical protein n=1 Tax=Kitasatospora sp. NPDC088346 TaxID=3364073 RepID=UPI0038024B30